MIDNLADIIMNATGGQAVLTMMIILWVSALLSATLDNIPFVATMIPLIHPMGESGMDVVCLSGGHCPWAHVWAETEL